jgi:hypothetical protein
MSTATVVGNSNATGTKVVHLLREDADTAKRYPTTIKQSQQNIRKI